MTRRILVTRPEPGASATAERLKAMGFSPVVLPLTRIVPAPPSDPGPCDAVAATSANALRHAPKALLAALEEKPLFAVGEATAEAARQAGFRAAHAAAGTAADLAALIASALPPGARILHLAGRDRTAGFGEELRRLGFGIEVAETYRAEEVSYSTDFLSRALETGPLWGALVFSTRGGALLAKIEMREEAKEALEGARFFCISAKAAAPYAGRRIAVAAAPTEEAVLALLSSQG